MSGTLVNIIMQIIAGAIGGSAAGARMENANLGGLGNAIAGALGGIGGGQIAAWLVPALSAAQGIDFTSVIGQLAAGSVGGAILTVIAGMLKNAMANR